MTAETENLAEAETYIRNFGSAILGAHGVTFLAEYDRLRAERDEALGLLRELVADSGWGFRPPPADLENRIQALVQRLNQASQSPARDPRASTKEKGPTHGHPDSRRRV